MDDNFFQDMSSVELAELTRRAARENQRRGKRANEKVPDFASMGDREFALAKARVFRDYKRDAVRKAAAAENRRLNGEDDSAAFLIELANSLGNDLGEDADE